MVSLDDVFVLVLVSVPVLVVLGVEKGMMADTVVVVVVLEVVGTMGADKKSEVVFPFDMMDMMVAGRVVVGTTVVVGRKVGRLIEVDKIDTMIH